MIHQSSKIHRELNSVRRTALYTALLLSLPILTPPLSTAAEIGTAPAIGDGSAPSQQDRAAFQPRSVDTSLLLLGDDDVVPPLTMAGPSVSGTTQTATRLAVTLNENGTGFYLVLPATAATPAMAALLAGTAIVMVANVAIDLAISGLSPASAYKIYFVARDAAGNRQTSIQSVAITTNGLPAGYVTQGGLIWMPVSNAAFVSYLSAAAVCAGTIDGQTGWRLPTAAELQSLYASGAMLGQGWFLGATWSSTPWNATEHLNVYLQNGNTSFDSAAYVSCVR
jgi:hypothetical protein